MNPTANLRNLSETAKKNSLLCPKRLIIGGHGDGDVVDGLLNLGVGLLEGLAEGGAAGDLEGGFVGVDGVHLTVVDVDDDVAGVGTCEGALLHLFHDTFEDGGHEL